METITDRAQVYWETLDPDFWVNAEEIFDMVRGKRDMGEDIKFIRSFLTGKFNEGEAFLKPNYSPPTYHKLEKKPPVVQYCTMLYNGLPDGEEMTLKSFKNRLPLSMQKSVKGVQNFFHRAKLSGALVNVVDEKGEVKKEGKGRKKSTVVKKVASIFELPPMGRLPKSAPVPESTQIAKDIFNMKASDVGMSIFELLHKLMTENKDQTESIKVLRETLNDTMKAHDSIVKDCNAVVEENQRLHNKINEQAVELTLCKGKLEDYEAKDKTYEELFREKQGELS